MAKPDYNAISEQLKIETDPEVRQELIDQLYTFTEELTEEEKALFGYFSSGYIEDDPGTVDGKFSSYIGKYYSSDGEIT
jgi:hypothetical protein